MADDYEVEVAELQAIARGDRDALSRCFSRCDIPLRQYLRRFAEVVDVEAIVQDTAMLVPKHASTIEPRRPAGFLLRWACKVALNKALNDAKRAGRLVPFEEPAKEDIPLAADAKRAGHLVPFEKRAKEDISLAADPFLRKRIRQCRERLQDRPRFVLDAHLEDGGRHPTREVATSVGVKFDAFRQNLKRARGSLERCLREYGIEVREYLR